VETCVDSIEGMPSLMDRLPLYANHFIRRIKNSGLKV